MVMVMVMVMVMAMAMAMAMAGNQWVRGSRTDDFVSIELDARRCS